MTSKLPPYSAEVEAGALACVTLDASLASEITVEMFYDIRHQTLASVLIDMAAQSKSLETISLIHELTAKGLLDACGGVSYVSGIPEATPSVYQFPQWKKELLELAGRRRILATAGRAITLAHDMSEPYESVIDRIERDSLAVRGENSDVDDGEIREAMRGVIDGMEQRFLNPDKLQGLSVGFPEIDNLTNGLKPGQVFILAARPSVGKTSLLLNIVENVVITQGLPALVFSLEMSKAELLLRMSYGMAGVNSSRDHPVSERDLQKISVATAKIVKSPLKIVDRPGITIGQLGATARRIHRKTPLAVVGIDYIGLMRSGTKRLENRTAELTEISGAVKRMAKELCVPFIALSQLNRDAAKADREPALHDLRDSGSVEQDADIVVLLHRPSKSTGYTFPIKLKMDKNRSGPVGEIELNFTPSICRFESASKIDSSDYPN